MSDSSAVVSAVTSVSGAVDAVADAPATISNIFELGGKLIYGTSYTAAYAIVFPAALIFAAIPKGNALLKGMIEGSAAARARAEGMLG
jgi:hypothetical protein